MSICSPGPGERRGNGGRALWKVISCTNYINYKNYKGREEVLQVCGVVWCWSTVKIGFGVRGRRRGVGGEVCIFGGVRFLGRCGVGCALEKDEGGRVCGRVRVGGSIGGGGGAVGWWAGACLCLVALRRASGGGDRRCACSNAIGLNGHGTQNRHCRVRPPDRRDEHVSLPHIDVLSDCPVHLTSASSSAKALGLIGPPPIEGSDRWGADPWGNCNAMCPGAQLLTAYALAFQAFDIST